MSRRRTSALLQALDADRTAGGDATERLCAIMLRLARREGTGTMDALRCCELCLIATHDPVARALPEAEDRWLRRQLAHGPRLVRDLLREWMTTGGTRRSLRATRDRLGVRSERVSGSEWQWRLPDGAARGTIKA